MKWYKKQLDKLKKESGEKLQQTSELKGEKSKKPRVNNPVKLRNINRPKTDSK